MQKAEFIMPTKGNDLKKIKDAIIEASNAQLQIDQHKDHIKMIKSDLEEELGIPKKLFGKMVKVYHKQTYGTEVAESETFQDLYEGIFPQESE